MQIYLVARWGNSESPDGPDGADTCFLVRATSYQAAAALVDEALASMPVSEGNNRQVQSFCHYVVLLGCSEGELSEGIVLGPWISHAVLNHAELCSRWTRVGNDEDWIEASSEELP